MSVCVCVCVCVCVYVPQQLGRVNLQGHPLLIVQRFSKFVLTQSQPLFQYRNRLKRKRNSDIFNQTYYLAIMADTSELKTDFKVRAVGAAMPMRSLYKYMKI